jgi:hypothetical protein
VVSQSDPSTGAGYNLYYASAIHAWAFSWHWTDDDGTIQSVRSVADLTSPPTGVWTNLTGVATQDSIQLYVNGIAQGSPVALPSGVTTVATTGDMELGRSWVQPAAPQYGDYFPGLIDEVHVWSRALQAPEVAQVAQADFLDGEGYPHAGYALVANWLAATAQPSISNSPPPEVPDTSGYGRSPLVLEGGATTNPDGSIRLVGSPNELVSSGQDFDETGGFTVEVAFDLDMSAVNQMGSGDYMQIIGATASATDNTPTWTMTYVDDCDSHTCGAGDDWGYYTLTVWDGSASTTVKSDDQELTDGASFADIIATFDPDYTSDGQLSGDDYTDGDPGYGQLTMYFNDTQSGTAATPVRHSTAGKGDLTVGVKPNSMGGGHWLVGDIDQIRLWSGALTGNDIEQLAGPEV